MPQRKSQKIAKPFLQGKWVSRQAFDEARKTVCCKGLPCEDILMRKLIWDGRGILVAFRIVAFKDFSTRTMLATCYETANG